MELTSVDEGFQDILLDAKIVVANGGELFSQLWEVLHGLFDPIVSHVIGSRFGAQAQMIADILLKKAVSVVSANHRVRKMDIFDYGLKLSFVVLGDLTTEDRGDLVGLADRAVGIQQSLAQLVQCRAAVKDQVVAVFDLGEKEPMLTNSLKTPTAWRKRPLTNRYINNESQVVLMRLVRD